MNLISRPQNEILRSPNQASEKLKAHNFVWQGCFFVHYLYIATSTTDWDQIFTGLLCYAYVEIHQVRRLVFDNIPIVSSVFKYCFSQVRPPGPWQRKLEFVDVLSFNNNKKKKCLYSAIQYCKYSQCALQNK